MYKVDPSQPFADFVNAMIGYDQRLNSRQIINQIQSSVGSPPFYGDPLIGTTITGTTITWDGATQVQQLIQVWHSASGTIAPKDYDAILKANAGPFEPWNYSYDTWASLGIIQLPASV